MTSFTPPIILEENKTLLKAWDLKTQPPVAYEQEVWLRYFSGNNDFDHVCNQFPKGLTRVDISNLSSETWLHPSVSLIRQLFIASMIWGYGTVGYGSYRTATMLKTPNFNELILKAFYDVRSGNLERAYQSLRISWCGPAFFTKFLYFAGLGGSLSVKPLILDSRVANGLEHLCDHSQVCFLKVERDKKGKIISVLRDWVSYSEYLDLFHNWSKELSCRPDSLEYYFFSKSGI